MPNGITQQQLMNTVAQLRPRMTAYPDNTKDSATVIASEGRILSKRAHQ